MELKETNHLTPRTMNKNHKKFLNKQKILKFLLLSPFLLSIPLKRIHPSVVNENNIDNFVFSTKKKKRKQYRSKI